MGEPVAERTFLKLTRFSIGAAVAVNLTMVAIRFLDGLPLGVDSTSHLFRIMLMSRSYRENGYVPQWNPDWYGGATLFLLYPPLSYYFTFAVSLTDLGPVLAYKLVDSAFLVLGPVVVYYLARSAGFDKREGVLAAFLFSFSPTIVENYLFYDRFPSIVSMPLVCIFMIALSRALAGKRRLFFLASSGALFGITILTHHLSALCAALFGLLLALTKGLSSQRPHALAHSMIVTTIVLLIGFSLSSFWSFPFIMASDQLLGNPFYNRNVEFPFIRLSYFSLNVITYAFGVAHTGLALFALWRHSLNSRLNKRFLPVTVGFMLTGMALFELGEKSGTTPMRVLGQSIVVLSLLTLSYALWRKGRSGSDQGPQKDFVWVSFVAFFWLSLGSYALPLVVMPPLSSIWRALDVHRFWLYLSIPMSILAAIGLKQLLATRTRSLTKRYWFLPVLLIGIIASGGCVKIWYAATHNISEFLPYPLTNRSIPPGLITYFRSDPTYARVLAIRCPLWIYVLPYYTNKPLIDGWYPQDKLLKHLLEINDYRILDLESAGPVGPAEPESPNRTRIWRDLTLKSRLFAIRWVIVGKVDEDVRLSLFNETNFRLDAQFSYEDGAITVYRSSEPTDMAELVPPDTGKVVLSRDSPDVLTLRLDLRGTSTVVIKEAYFPTWRAVSAGVPLDIEKDSEGFMTIRVPVGVTEIKLYHKPVDLSIYYLSAVTLAVLLLLIGFDVARRGVSTRRAEP